jgi:hypothetical protein
MKIDPSFKAFLEDFNLEALEEHEGVVYGTWPDTRLGFLNRAWDNEKSGDIEKWTLNSKAIDAIPKVLRPFYEDHFNQVLSKQQPWEHLYECSTPSRYRVFHMITYPLEKQAGFLTVHSLYIDTLYPEDSLNPLENQYRDENGLIHQCSHCRRIQRINSKDTWDWIPKWVEHPDPNTSHSLCEPCLDFFYKGGDFPAFISSIDTEFSPAKPWEMKKA